MNLVNPTKLLAIVLFMLIFFVSFYHFTYDKSLKEVPEPKEGFEENEEAREKWFESIHRAAPGTDWRIIENKNLERSINFRKNFLYGKDQRISENIANGALQGNWEERGSDNQAGRVNAVDYTTATDNLYVISNGGTLWKKKLSGGNWLPLNKDIRCLPGILSVLPLANGQNRILIAYKNNIQYSDDDGKTFIPSSGILFPVVWGDNIKNLVVSNDAQHSIYCLALPWDPLPWQPRYWLYRSTDLGKTFTKIYTFGFGDDGMLSLNAPYNSKEVYALDTKSQNGMAAFYSVSGNNVSLLNKAIGPDFNTRCVLKGSTTNGITALYALSNNRKVYVSDNLGSSWILQSTLAADAPADQFEVSMDDPSKLFCGGVEAYRSTTSGTSWIKINGWGEYYNNPASKLHADIMQISSFKKQDGSTFVVVNCDGGCYVSNDNLTSCANISLSSLSNSQYYDVLTDPQNSKNLFAGSQDQGLQRNTSATGLGILNFNQVISGDYTQLALSGNARHLWAQYPGAVIYFYNNSVGNLSTTWKMPGTNLPNYGWTMPMTNIGVPNSEEVLIGGGDLSAGSGSYIMKIKPSPVAPFNISASQYNYDFRANSKNGISGVTAIETDKADSNRIYVATEDGTFFYTVDAGKSWSKSVNFSGPAPGFLFASSIYASRLTPGLVWFGGSGYSNPPVYKSKDGGKTFISMSNGLPATLVYEIVANPSENMLFAATEAGPYVFVEADNQWYSMMGADNPLQAYTTVQYITDLNIVRFGTYGRGIWDFKITNALPSAPKITFSSATTFCQGDSVTLSSSAASGNQWYKNNIQITGATSDTLHVTQTGNYTVRSTFNGYTTEPSTAISVQVNLLPQTPLLFVRGSTAICQGNTASISSSASSGNQWYKDGAIITGATESIYLASQNGSYTVRVTDASGCTSKISEVVHITVTPLPTVPTVNSSGVTTFCEGGNIELSSSSLTNNQWFLDNTVISGATNQKFIASKSGSYSVAINSNGCTSDQSPVIVVVVKQVPPQPTITAQNNTLQSSSVNGNQWYINGTAIPLAVANTYTASIPGQYSVEVTTNGCASPMSANVSISQARNPGGLRSRVIITPNPVSNILYIISNNSTDKIVVALFDMHGKLLVKGSFINRYEIKMSSFATGNYIVKLINEKNKDHYEKIVLKR